MTVSAQRIEELNSALAAFDAEAGNDRGQQEHLDKVLQRFIAVKERLDKAQSRGDAAMPHVIALRAVFGDLSLGFSAVARRMNELSARARGVSHAIDAMLKEIS